MVFPGGEGIAATTVLEIGGGVGEIQLELLAARRRPGPRTSSCHRPTTSARKLLREQGWPIAPSAGSTTSPPIRSRSGRGRRRPAPGRLPERLLGAAADYAERAVVLEPPAAQP